MGLENTGQLINSFVNEYVIHTGTKRSGNSIPCLRFELKCFHSSSPACSSAETAPDVSFDNSGRAEHFASAAVCSEQYVFYMKYLFSNPQIEARSTLIAVLNF